MSAEEFERFREAVLQDHVLQEHLRTEPDETAFIALVVRTGTERGFQFNAADVREALQASLRAWLERSLA